MIQHVDSAFPRPVRWIGSSREDLAGFPQPVRRHMGIAIYQARLGSRHRYAKPLKGFGPGVLEVIARHDGDTYRGIYTVRFQDAVYVLHAFQKKATRDIATPKRDLDLVRRRLRLAAQLHAAAQAED